MKLELAVFLVSAVFVSNVVGQDLNMMLRLMGMDPIPLPPKPPKSLFPQLYQSSSGRTQMQRPQPMTRQQMQMMQQQLLQRRRDEQERLILRKLQSMSPERLKQLQDNLTPDQLKMLVDRIQYLKQTQQQATQQKGQPTPRDQNTVISMANRIRTIKDPNALTATSTSTRVPSRSNGGPLHSMQQIHSYHKKSRDAHAAGCRHPMGMGAMATALMFRSCANPAASSACAVTGGQCVNVGVSIMCCPLGYNSRVIDAVNYMKRMEQFMAQMS